MQTAEAAVYNVVKMGWLRPRDTVMLRRCGRAWDEVAWLGVVVLLDTAGPAHPFLRRREDDAAEADDEAEAEVSASAQESDETDTLAGPAAREASPEARSWSSEPEPEEQDPHGEYGVWH